MAREDKIFQLAKGFRGRAKNCYRIAVKRVQKALQYSYRDRRQKRRSARKLWIMQLKAGANEHGLSYSKMIYGLKLEHIGLDRKILSTLARQEPYSFRALVEEAKQGLRKAVLGQAGPAGSLLVEGGQEPAPRKSRGTWRSPPLFPPRSSSVASADEDAAPEAAAAAAPR